MSRHDRKAYFRISAWFRSRRNRDLVVALDSLESQVGDELRILDVGGLPEFWKTVPGHEAHAITIVNSGDGQFSSEAEVEVLSPLMQFRTGDACDLSEFDDEEFDFVVCNSVLEHVGPWANVLLASSEVRRVGRHGWVQVPAFEFPLEVHFMLPFVHWFAEPIRARILWLMNRTFRSRSRSEVRLILDYVRLLSRTEFEGLFPGDSVSVERVLFLPKSYIARW